MSCRKDNRLKNDVRLIQLHLLQWYDNQLRTKMLWGLFDLRTNKDQFVSSLALCFYLGYFKFTVCRMFKFDFLYVLVVYQLLPFNMITHRKIVEQRNVICKGRYKLCLSLRNIRTCFKINSLFTGPSFTVVLIRLDINCCSRTGTQ